MKKVIKTYYIREKPMWGRLSSFSGTPLTFSNRKDYIGELTYNSVIYVALTEYMYTLEATINRKYQIK